MSLYKYVICLNKKSRDVNQGKTVKLNMDFFYDISYEKLHTVYSC